MWLPVYIKDFNQNVFDRDFDPFSEASPLDKYHSQDIRPSATTDHKGCFTRAYESLKNVLANPAVVFQNLQAQQNFH